MRRIVKKRPQADAVDPERWLVGTPERASGPQSWRLLRAIAEAVLPQPQSQIGLFTLWGSVSTDFVLLFMGFIAASQTRFGLRLFFGLSVDPARSVALPFSRGYLGLVLVYGALVTLLGYVEGLYSADPDCSIQAQLKSSWRCKAPLNSSIGSRRKRRTRRQTAATPRTPYRPKVP